MNIMINPYHGVSRTVKATYYKSSLANFLHTESRGAGGVLIIERYEKTLH